MKIIIARHNSVQLYVEKAARELEKSGYEVVCLTVEEIYSIYKKNSTIPSFFVEKHGKLCHSLYGKHDIKKLKSWAKEFDDSTN